MMSTEQARAIEAHEGYQVMRSRNNTHLFVVCYADRFHDNVPLEVRNRGP